MAGAGSAFGASGVTPYFFQRSEAIHPQAQRMLVDCFAFGSQ
jgi:hypothetical protein